MTGLEVPRKKAVGLTYWQLQSSHGDVEGSNGNAGNDTVITMQGASRVLEISRGTLCEVCDCLTAMLHTCNQYKIKLEVEKIDNS